MFHFLQAVHDIVRSFTVFQFDTFICDENVWLKPWNPLLKKFPHGGLGLEKLVTSTSGIPCSWIFLCRNGCVALHPSIQFHREFSASKQTDLLWAWGKAARKLYNIFYITFILNHFSVILLMPRDAEIAHNATKYFIVSLKMLTLSFRYLQRKCTNLDLLNFSRLSSRLVPGANDYA